MPEIKSIKAREIIEKVKKQDKRVVSEQAPPAAKAKTGVKNARVLKLVRSS